MTEKVCTVCGLSKDETQFQRRSDTGRLRNECRQCRSAASLRRYHDNPSTRAATHRAARKHQLRKLYGVSPETYDAMLVRQGGACAICPAPEGSDGRRYLCVDHDHATGQVRGLLCNDCNTGLGMFRDNRSFLANAALYLEKPPCS